ncbi:MAG: carboxypeptidase regulatory-like domain-containing protein [Acidobacteriota bacterium]
MKWVRAFAGLWLLAVVANNVPLHAQTSFGKITGILRDTSGAVLPDANVTATNEKTGITRQVRTDSGGNYLIPSLPPSTYTVEAELKGFKKAVSSKIVLEVNQTLRVDLTLEVGEITQTVEVEASAPLLQSETSTVGTVIENKQVVELPLNGRSFTELTYLIPGAVRQGGAIFQTSGSRVSVSGARAEDNNYTLDGVNNNETFFKAFAVQPSIDAIQEFKIQTNVTSAEFGQAAGANVNVVTKSGTNDIHGGVFEFLRNDVFDARDSFAPRKPVFRQNQFGGQVGGPAIKNRTFWFFNYEGYRFRRAATALGTIPTPEMFNGNLAFDHTGKAAAPIFDPLTTRPDGNGGFIRDPFPGNIIPADRIDPIIKSYVQIFYPRPNLPGQNANVINTQSGSLDTNQYTIRADHKISDNNNFFSRFSYVQSEQLNPRPLGTHINSTSNAFRNFMISDTHLFNATTILDVKLAYHRNNLQIAEIGPSDLATVQSWLQTTGIQGIPIKNSNVPLYPQFFIAGYTNPNQDGYPFPDDTYQILANLSKTKGKHFIKFGMDYQNRRNLDDGLFSANIDFTKTPTEDPQNATGTGQALASYLLGLPTNALRNVGDTTALMRWSGYYFYFQDDIKISPKLTMNLGLRYDYTQWPRHRDNKLGSFDLETGQYLWATTNPITGQPANTFPTVIYPDRNNFAPRVGMAYLLNNKTTIRAGYGWFYNTNFLWEAQGIRGNWPFAISETLTNLNTTVIDSPLKTTFQPYVATGPDTNVPADAQHIADRNRRVSYNQQWNLHLQREVAGNLLLEVGYVGTRGSKASIFANANTAPPGPGPVQPRRPFTNLGATSLMTDIASSIYHGAQFKAEKRFSEGLAFLGSYTFSRNINTGGDGFSLSSSPQDPNCLECDRALSAFHRKHIFAMNFVYELPFGAGKPFGTDLRGVANHVLGGWQFNGIITASTGQPIGVGIGRDIANIGARSIGQRPNINGNPNLSNPTANRWFDTSVFSEPAPFTYGNAGRNIIIGPGNQTWTLGLYKNFMIMESHRIQFRVEFFNAFNNVNLNNPTTGFDSPNLGRIFGSAPARQIQFGLKYNF